MTEPKADFTLAKGSTGNKVYAANWIASKYIVTLDLNDGAWKIAKDITIKDNWIGIEIKEDGTVTVNTPIAAENSYKISDPYDPFANIMFDTLDELKMGEHIEAQWNEYALKDQYYRAISFMMSKETYKKLYLQIIGGLIFVCMDVNIKEEDFEKGWVSERIREAVKKVEKGAFGIREVTGVHKQYW